VIAAPLWAFERKYWGWSQVDEAWSDIEAELQRRWEELPKTEGWGVFRRRLVRSQRCNAHLHHGGQWRERTCLACGEDFMSTSHGRHAVTCTEACAAARRMATHVPGKQPRPHVEHEPRPCGRCGEPFTPTRADARYCSVRCRVAHHRGR
jgi:hypothetical protein